MSGTARVEAILWDTPWFMAALEAARTVDPPDWLIGAGAVRTAVWDHLHGFDEPTVPGDVDVAFFDPNDLSRARDQAIEEALRERLPDTPWDAKNQAAVHLWYPAKFGYEVLLRLVHRRNPARVTVEEYERRLRSKRIVERWPLVTPRR